MKIIDTNTGTTCKPRRIPSSAKMTSQQVQHAYDQTADAYDKKIWFDQNILGIARLRRNLFSKAWGKVLDVACGTGINFSSLSTNAEITAIDLSSKMLEIAAAYADELGLEANFLVMDAENLKYPNGSFDTVISALSTCTFPDPIKALQEMKRVCKPGGLILLLEHGHSSVPWLAHYQDRHEYQHYEDHAGCRWNQDPLKLVEAAGLKIIKSQRSILGMYHSVEAKPV